MSSFLKPLSDIRSPDLIEFDRDALTQEIVQRIQSDPNWNSIWDGELLHNYSYFIINTFSYLFSKNAEAANRVLKETFITQAKDPLSIVNYLSNFSLNLKQNTTSTVEVTIRPNDGGSFTNEFYLNAGYQIQATTINSSTAIYELYNLELDEFGLPTGKIDYRSPIVVPAQNFVKVYAFSGITTKQTFTLNALTEREKFIYNINDPDIIEDSIRIYYQYGSINEVELIETDSFIITPKIIGNFTADLGGVPHYKIKYNSDGTAKIIFGSREFGGSFPASGGVLTFFYRTGGGITSNIVRGGINSVITLPVDNFNSIDVLFYNFLSSGGGADRENIDEAQFYAPYRIGRGKSIVDDIDALNLLRSSVVKHRVESPKYNGINVPVLHYHNYIVPIRNFDNFAFPVPNSTDIYVTYKEILELELNKFLNLSGIHDGAENDILITFFRDTDFYFPLPYKPILNGSLYVSAYDSNSKEIDRLIFGQNYEGQINLPDAAIKNASITSSDAIGNISISIGREYLYFKIDGLQGNYSLNNSANDTCFRVALAINQYTVDNDTLKNTALASHIDLKIRSIDPYYSSFPESTPFAYIDDDKKLVIRSLTTGSNSTIQLYSPNVDSVLSLLNMVPEKSDASPQNREVFLETSVYNADLQQVNIKLNTDWIKEKNYTRIVNNWGNPTSQTGPIITLSLVDENNNPIFLQRGTDLIIKAVNPGISDPVDVLTFSNISSTSTNFGSASSNNVFDDTNTNACYYKYSTGEIVIKLIDSNSVGPDYSFPIAEDGVTELYNSQTIFNVVYSKKTYNFVTVSSTPNPYYGESEAQNFLLKLKDKNKKMMAIEPLLKKVIFKPLLLEVKIIPSKGFSREQSIQDTLKFIYDNFAYDNMIPENSIGTGFNIKTFETYLNNKLILPSVERSTITIPYADYEDPDENTYYFIFDENFMGRLKQLEVTYPQLSGLYDSYKLRVKIA